jgi:hypothetical protein
MFVQIVVSGFFPIVSFACFPLAVAWLVVALLLLRRYVTQA